MASNLFDDINSRPALVEGAHRSTKQVTKFERTSDPYPSRDSSTWTGMSKFSSERYASTRSSSRHVALVGGLEEVSVGLGRGETVAGIVGLRDSTVEKEGSVAELDFLNANFGLRVLLAAKTVCSDLSSCKRESSEMLF